MRQSMAGICFLVLFFLTVGPSSARDCPACTYFESFRLDGGSQLFIDILAQLESRPEARVTLDGGAFCETGPGASVAAALVRAADDQFARASAIAARIEQCPNSCAPELALADYCAFGRRLVVDRYRLGAIGLRLSELGRLYERAAGDGQEPIQVLAADVSRHGAAALIVLARALSALADGGGAGAMPDVRWDASATEVAGLFDAVALLADFSLIGGDADQIEAALEISATQVNTLRNDLKVVMGRGQALEPSELLAFERRILTAASELAYVMSSLQVSAGATDVPGENDAAEARRAAACLNQLSFSSMGGSEAPDMADELLSTCRSFESCDKQTPIHVPANISPLKALLQEQAQAWPQTRVLVDSICAPEQNRTGG